jgi:hypothetical protein
MFGPGLAGLRDERIWKIILKSLPPKNLNSDNIPTFVPRRREPAELGISNDYIFN